jgi:hypothetical protein
VDVTLEHADGQSLIIDYLLYQPNFQSLATMPKVTAPPKPSASSTAGMSTSSAAATPSGSSVGTSPASEMNRKSRVTPIAGSIIGSFVALALILALFFFYLRRRRTTQRQEADNGMSASFP